ncbi:MAG: 6-phosphogluconolactonase [Parachlamydiaceae bacterium]|nr:6-phosphogluconolactonase [Parachlamydiaceae bacterium]
MAKFNWKNSLKVLDERRDVIIPGNADETVTFCVEQFVAVANQQIRDNGIFTVAFSGGSTPNAIFNRLSQVPYRDQIDWTKVLCFWSDERAVPPNDKESNYHNAIESGLSLLPIPKEHLFRMKGEGDIEENAKQYEKTIIEFVPSRKFDLLMLGMGEDGHTASLFPKTHGLHTIDRLAIANYVPQKDTWRLSLTYECINSAHLICIYAIGKNKAEMVAKVFTSDYDPNLYPIQRVGTPHNKAVWILDQDAALKLSKIILSK